MVTTRKDLIESDSDDNDDDNDDDDDDDDIWKRRDHLPANFLTL